MKERGRRSYKFDRHQYQVRNEQDSILCSDLAPPERPHGTLELQAMRAQLLKSRGLSIECVAAHDECRHLYHIRENGQKFKQIAQNQYDVGNCSVCWKLSRTPVSLRESAEQLIVVFLENHFSEMPYDFVQYQIEKVFYIWLYDEFYK